jgi:IPT/TIG domain-containing protein
MVQSGRSIKRGPPGAVSAGRVVRAAICWGVAGVVMFGAPAVISAADAVAIAPAVAQGITITAQATPLTLGLGSGFNDSATLAPPAGGPAPTGTISFSVYGPTDPGCAGPVIFNSTNTVVATPTLSGDYVTSSGGLTPANVGTYHVTATYSGDGNYRPVGTSCGDPAETVLVGARPTLTAISPTTGPAGGANLLTITGTNLAGASAVNFGSVAVAASVISATEVTAIAPAGSGTVDVTVTTQFGTTAKSAADAYAYAAAPAGPAPIVTPGNPGNQPPIVATGQTMRITSSTAELTGTVDPSGTATSAYFEYTVRLGAGASVTGHTSTQIVGADLASHSVTADVTGLLARSHYRVRLVATTAAGPNVVGAATTFTTTGNPPPAPPVVGRTFNAAPVSGLVYVRVPGAGKPVQPLTDARQLPVGTTLDTRHGVVRLTSATSTAGRTASASFSGATVTFGQSRSGAAVADLQFVRASTSRKICSTPAGQAPPETVLAAVHATTTGRFAVRGRAGSATGAAATWTTTDRCDGLLTTVNRGTVTVDDAARGRSVALGRGQTYLANAA